MTRSFIIASMIAALLGCNAMVVRHPEMAATSTIVHRVEPGRIWTFCSGSLSILQKLTLSLPVGCSWMYYPSKQCHIFVGENAPESTVDHERKHCDGWLHDDGPAREYAKLVKLAE